MECRGRTDCVACLFAVGWRIDTELEAVLIDVVLLVMILDRVGRPFGEFVTDGVGVEAPSWSWSSSSLSFSLMRESRSSMVEQGEVVFTDGDLR